MPNVKLNIMKCLQFNLAHDLRKKFIKRELLNLEFNQVIAIFKWFTKNLQ